MKEDQVYITILIVCLFFGLELDFEGLNDINMIKLMIFEWIDEKVGCNCNIFGGGWI